jgi:purine-binding chemotaxis protein CheW
MEKQEVAKQGQYLTFTLNKQLYGVSIGVVREINRMSEITKVPQTPDFVSGVLNLRGRVIPVVDLRKKFDIYVSAYTKGTCVVIIEAEYGQVGMVVDTVSGVIDLKDQQIDQRPVLGDEKKVGYVKGLGRLENGVVILIDIVAALSKEEILSGGVLTELSPKAQVA